MVAVAAWMRRLADELQKSVTKANLFRNGFYGDRTNFLAQNTQKEATVASKALGANAIPFAGESDQARDSRLHFKPTGSDLCPVAVQA